MECQVVHSLTPNKIGLYSSSSYSRGALLEGAFEVEFGCGACGRASQARTREVGGHRPGPLRGSAGNGWTGAGEGRRKPVRNEGLSLVLPSTRKRGPSNRKAAMARRKAMRGSQGPSQGRSDTREC
jgi:hypothetical protein